MPSKTRIKRVHQPTIPKDLGLNYTGIAIPAKSSFVTLPYDIKYFICRQPELKALDLLHLSHTNKAWYSAASAESLFKSWYKVVFTLPVYRSTCRVI